MKSQAEEQYIAELEELNLIFAMMFGDNTIGKEEVDELTSPEFTMDTRQTYNDEPKTDLRYSLYQEKSSITKKELENTGMDSLRAQVTLDCIDDYLMDSDIECFKGNLVKKSFISEVCLLSKTAYDELYDNCPKEFNLKNEIDSSDYFFLLRHKLNMSRLIDKLHLAKGITDLLEDHENE